MIILTKTEFCSTRRVSKYLIKIYEYKNVSEMRVITIISRWSRVDICCRGWNWHRESPFDFEHFNPQWVGICLLKLDIPSSRQLSNCHGRFK